VYDTSLILCTAREQDGGGRYVASGTKQNPTKQIDYSVRCESDPDTFTAVHNLMGNVEADVNAITVLFVCVIYGDCKHENKHSVSIEQEEFLH